MLSRLLSGLLLHLDTDQITVGLVLISVVVEKNIALHSFRELDDLGLMGRF